MLLSTDTFSRYCTAICFSAVSNSSHVTISVIFNTSVILFNVWTLGILGKGGCQHWWLCYCCIKISFGPIYKTWKVAPMECTKIPFLDQKIKNFLRRGYALLQILPLAGRGTPSPTLNRRPLLGAYSASIRFSVPGLQPLTYGTPPGKFQQIHP